MHFFSIIIPVYNRPNEIEELLASILHQKNKLNFEVLIIEDGSTKTSEKIITKYQDKINLRYFKKKNTGPGDSRNYGMQKATGDYFIILDSDVILPKDYFFNLKSLLKQKSVDAFGGVDDAHPSFTDIQKAINYAMTSFFTTGGLRNTDKNNFQLRSFNMGISKEVFNKTKGFSKQRYGEDIDLSNRIKQLGYQLKIFPSLRVFHKRRVNFEQFFKQIFNFGRARPILNKMHSGTSKITYWFPTIFTFGLVLAIILLLLKNYWLFIMYVFYFILITIDAFIKYKSISVALYTVYATLVQFVAYGIGFFRSWVRLHLQHKSIKETFPQMFF